LNMAAYVTKGLVLNIVSKIAVNRSEMTKEAKGTRKMALRDRVFLFSKIMRIRISIEQKPLNVCCVLHVVSYFQIHNL